ncbi:GNAT family N-acetyltransferase [Nonomuraea sp. KM90]|uniref:GNAT family N-acetyltransferase n=1 Tax=Nonomuraea sp. KM90 TaxID=3457428 RepID=UPI003FCC99CD
MTTRMAEHTTAQPDLRDVPYDHPDAVTLVRALYDDQVARYGYADPAEAPPALFTPPHGLFLVCYVGDMAVACGGYRAHRPVADTVEIKKMYTRPDHRGRGLGRRILDHLEQHARAHGAKWAILETGVRNDAARALYETMGYQPTNRYVADRDPAINRAFLKSLSSAATG